MVVLEFCLHALLSETGSRHTHTQYTIINDKHLAASSTPQAFMYTLLIHHLRFDAGQCLYRCLRPAYRTRVL